MVDLIVTAAFADYARGDRISDPETVAALVDDGRADAYCVRVAALSAKSAPVAPVENEGNA